MLQQKDVCVSCGFLLVTFSKEGSQQLCCQYGLLCWVSPLLCPTSPLGLLGSSPGLTLLLHRYCTSASPSAHAEAREHCQNMRGGRRSFSRLLGPFGNHHFPGNMFQMCSFRRCASPGSRGRRLPGALGRSWCLLDGTGGLCCGLWM